MRNLRIQFWPPLEQELIGRSFCRRHRLRTLRPKLKRRQRWRLNTPLSVSRTRSNFAVIRKLKRDRWSRLRRLHVETETRARPILRPKPPRSSPRQPSTEIFSCAHQFWLTPPTLRCASIILSWHSILANVFSNLTRIVFWWVCCLHYYICSLLGSSLVEGNG